MNLAEVSAIFPGYQRGQLTQEQIKAAQQANAMQQLQLQVAQGEAGANLSSIASLFQQQPGPGGGALPSNPAAAPAQAPGSAAPGASFMPVNPGAPPMAPASPGGGPGGPSMGDAAQAPGGAPGGAGGSPLAGLGLQPTFGQVFMAIKAKNPTLPDTTVLALAGKVQQMVNPADKMYLQYLMNMQGHQTIERGQDIRAQTQADAQQNQRVIAGANMAGRTNIAGMNIQSRESIAAAVNAIRQSEASGAGLPDQTRQFLAQALISGDNQTIQLALGFSRNRAQLLSQIVETAQTIDPTFTGQRAAAAVAQFGGMKAAANVAGRTAGATAVGAAEIPQLAPLIVSVASRLNPTQFPDVNAVERAVERRTGNADVVLLNSYIQSLKNAYQQIMSRGGRMTDFQRHQANDLMSGNMPLAQLSAAALAMTTEASIVKGATGKAMQDVTGGPPASAEGGPPASAEGGNPAAMSDDDLKRSLGIQ